jgi:hypothetical protein
MGFAALNPSYLPLACFRPERLCSVAFVGGDVVGHVETPQNGSLNRAAVTGSAFFRGVQRVTGLMMKYTNIVPLNSIQ